MTEPTNAPESTSLPADVAAMTPDAARAEIDATRAADPLHPWKDAGHRGHDAATVRMALLYQRVHAPGPAGDGPPSGLAAASDATAVAPSDEPTPEGASEEPGPETIIAADLPPGFTWDEPTLNELGALADREQIDTGLLREGTALVARLLTERAPALTGEEAEDVLAQRWGSKYEHQIARATETWNLLPKKVQDDLTRSGVRYHPEFAEYLLRIGDHRWDAMTDAGLARIKARSLAALAAAGKQGTGG